MKLLNKPERIRESLEIPFGFHFKPMNLFRGKPLFESTESRTFSGRISYGNIFIETDVEHPIGVKIHSLMIPGENYEFFGLIPINRVGKVTEFTIDYFEI